MDIIVVMFLLFKTVTLTYIDPVTQNQLTSGGAGF